MLFAFFTVYTSLSLRMHIYTKRFIKKKHIYCTYNDFNYGLEANRPWQPAYYNKQDYSARPIYFLTCLFNRKLSYLMQNCFSKVQAL